MAGLAVRRVESRSRLIPVWQGRRWAAAGIGDKESGGAKVVAARGKRSCRLSPASRSSSHLVATWMQIADTREASEQMQELNRAEQETERFTRAVSQLGVVESRTQARRNLRPRTGGDGRTAVTQGRRPLSALGPTGQLTALPIAGCSLPSSFQLEFWGSNFGPCKTTFVEANADMQAAIDVLRRIEPDPSTLELREARPPRRPHRAREFRRRRSTRIVAGIGAR